MVGFSGLTCPECRGPLYESGPGPVEFQCRVGHALPLKTMFEEHTSLQERKLYEAIVAPGESAGLADLMASAWSIDEFGKWLSNSAAI